MNNEKKIRPKLSSRSTWFCASSTLNAALIPWWIFFLDDRCGFVEEGGTEQKKNNLGRSISVRWRSVIHVLFYSLVRLRKLTLKLEPFLFLFFSSFVVFVGDSLFRRWRTPYPPVSGSANPPTEKRRFKGAPKKKAHSALDDRKEIVNREPDLHSVK